MDDVLDVLRADHARIAAILAELRGNPTEPGDPRHRARVREQLVVASSKHEALEEMVLWPEVRRRLASGEALASVGLDQEAVGLKLLNELDKTDSGNEGFATLFHQVESSLRRHMMFEENQVFFGLARVLPDEEAASLARRVDATRRLAPSRPRTHVPSRPPVVRMAGPVTGAFDRGRDLFSRPG